MSDNKKRDGISRKTFDRLKKFGIKDSTWDSILNDLMDHADACDDWWNRES